MKGLSLKSFKKIHEDKDWATLIHKDGHKINIAKAPLSPIMRKQIENLETHEENVYGRKVEHFDEGGVSGQASSQPSEMQGIMGDVAANAPNPIVQTAPPPPSKDDDYAPPPPPSPINPDPNLPKGGLEQQQYGEYGKGQAEAAQATSIGKAGNAYATKMNETPTANELAEGNKENDVRLYNELASKKINPEQYWQGDPATGQNGHSKLLAGIGVLISSLGQGIGQGKVTSNGALDAIEAGINRNIDLQKNSQEQTMNLYKMNEQAYQNKIAATLATQNQYTIMAKQAIDAAGANAQGDVAKNAAVIASGKLQADIDMRNTKIGLLKSNNPQDYPTPEAKVAQLLRMGMVTPEQGNKLAEEIKNRRDLVQATPRVLNAWDMAHKDTNYLNPSQASPSAYIPYADTPGQKAFEAEINPTVKESEGSARATAFQSIKSTLEPKGPMTPEAARIQRASIPDYLASHASEPLSKIYGLDLDQWPETNLKQFQHALPPQSKMHNGQKVLRGTK
jgi:hypothetical protein